MKKSLKNSLFLVCLCLSSCMGNGGSSDDNENPSPSPSATSTTDDLASLVVNTFLENGVNVTADPTYLDFGTTEQDDKIKMTVTITNGSSQSLTLTMSFYGTSSGFRVIESDGSFVAYKPDFVLAPGEKQEFKIQYDASILGVSRGYIEVTDANSSNYVHIPFQGIVASATDFKIISASDMCSNSDAPSLSTLDFLKVASEKSKEKSFKICNTSISDITLNSITFSTNTSGAVSAAIDTDSLDNFILDIADALDTTFADYYNPPQTSGFSEPIPRIYEISPNEPAAFSVIEDSTGKTPRAILIPTGSFALFHVNFEPTLNIEAPEGELYEPIPYAADMIVSTSLGNLTVDAVGASGGKEPMLQVTYTPAGETASWGIDTDSAGAAISFGTVSIPEDWVPEHSKDVTLTFTNVGSGEKNLEIWAEKMESGYFTFVEESPEKTFPLELAPDGPPVTLTLRYAPTPTANADGNYLAQDSYDMGQLVLQQTGGNGPENRITLYGEETSSSAVEAYQESSKLKSTTSSSPYSADRPKSLCAVKIGSSVSKAFTIYNNSSHYKLTTTLSVGDLSNVSARLSRSSLSVNAGSASTFNLVLTTSSRVAAGRVVSGRLRIDNHYASSYETTFGQSPNSYDVYFSATASADGVCSGGGTPVDGDAFLVIDRISMNLAGLEPARNPPAFKMYIPLKVDKAHEVATIGALPFDPINTDPAGVDVFKPYNHQMANVKGCFPLPTNPYKRESDPGSWTGGAQCNYTSSVDEGIRVEGTEACMVPNKPELVTVDDKNYYVFYHEFVKFNPTTCATEIEGKIATFYLQETSPGVWQSIEDVFNDMAAEVGTDGEVPHYQAFLHTFQFNSFMKFSANYDQADCVQSAGTTLNGDTQSEEIGKCWDAFGSDATMIRNSGMIEECTYFYFDVAPGCVPPDVPWKAEVPAEQLCSADKGSTYANKDTWIGFGEYEPHLDLSTGEQDDTKWDFTLRNVHLTGSFVVNSLGLFFDNAAKLLFADLYATITTKAIGNDETDWNDLIAVNNRDDLEKSDVRIKLNDAEAQWTNDGINSVFTTGEFGDPTGDDKSCFDSPAGSSCRGNYIIRPNNEAEIVPAGEPADFVHNNRFLLVGYGVFGAVGNLAVDQLAPSFARQDSSGKGKPLVFTLHGCMAKEEDIAGDSNYGCYDGHIDSTDEEGNTIPRLLEDYKAAGILTAEDVTNAQSSDPAIQAQSKAWINFRIFNQDRDRLTDYYNTNNYFFDKDYYTSTPCGSGM